MASSEAKKDYAHLMENKMENVASMSSHKAFRRASNQ